MQASVPQLKSFNDLINPDLREQIKTWCSANPLQDHIYTLKFQATQIDKVRKNPIDNATSANVCIAGSYALYELLTKAIHPSVGALKCNFEPSDIDIFILGEPGPYHKVFGHTDLVHCPEKTVEELLMNFDLPVCRVATNSHLDYWISIQALNSIINRVYYMPEYCRYLKSFTDFIVKYREPVLNSDEPYYIGGMPVDRLPAEINHALHRIEKIQFDRLQERIKKYASRGFNVIWISKEKVLPWVRQRFHYAVWKQENEWPKQEVEVKIAMDKIVKARGMTFVNCYVNGTPTILEIETNDDLSEAFMIELVKNQVNKRYYEFMKFDKDIFMLGKVTLVSS